MFRKTTLSLLTCPIPHSCGALFKTAPAYHVSEVICSSHASLLKPSEVIDSSFVRPYFLLKLLKHISLPGIYEGWKDAESSLNGHEYAWRNFLSVQTLKAIESLRKQFFSLLKDTGLIEENSGTCNMWSHDEDLVQAVIGAGLYPGISSVANKEKSIKLKTMEDGQVLFHSDGCLKMLGGYLEFFMKSDLAVTYLTLKQELDELIHTKLLNPKANIYVHEQLLAAMRILVSEDPREGRFVFSRQEPRPTMKAGSTGGKGAGGSNSKNQLQTLLARTGHVTPTYRTKQLKNSMFRACFEFHGMQFLGQPFFSKKASRKKKQQLRQWSG